MDSASSATPAGGKKPVNDDKKENAASSSAISSHQVIDVHVNDEDDPVPPTSRSRPSLDLSSRRIEMSVPSFGAPKVKSVPTRSSLEIASHVAASPALASVVSSPSLSRRGSSGVIRASVEVMRERAETKRQSQDYRAGLNVVAAASEIRVRQSLEVERRRSLESKRVKVEGIPELVSEEEEKEKAKAKAVKIKKGKKEKKTKAETVSFDIPEHKLSVAELATALETRLDVANPGESKGLTSEEAAQRLQRDGPNILTPPPTTPEWIKYLREFTNFFMILLEMAGILSFISYGIDTSQSLNLYVGIILYAIVIFTATLSYVQDRQSTAVMDTFKKMLPQKCVVRRDNQDIEIFAEDLVVGDIIVLKFGNKVPADVRVLTSSGIKVDNSSLTGEPEPQSRAPDSNHDSFVETQNLCFLGTAVMEGEGRGVVVRTGDNTYIGGIANLASTPEAEETTLSKEIKHFVKFVAGLGLVCGGLIFAIGAALKGNNPGVTWNIVVLNAIGAIIANVPEGLPATVTACLTITARRLAVKKVFIKKLEVVETLGSCTVICSDKTGTLTKNLMSISHIYYDGNIFGIDPSIKAGYFDRKQPSCAALLRIGSCCNRAVFDGSSPTHDETGREITLEKRPVLGDASESAIFRFCESIESTTISRDFYKKVFEIPFSSATKWQLSIHKDAPTAATRSLFIKGAPEIIFKMCTHILKNGESVPITPEMADEFQSAYEELGSMGERVLGFAMQKLDPAKYGPSMDKKYDVAAGNFPQGGHTFVGLMSLIDPPRDTVPDAIEKCRTAGIKVFMVTGDHPLTAHAIAKKVGIISLDTVDVIAKHENIPVSQVDRNRAQAAVIHGAQIATLADEDWDWLISRKELVFARTTPEQKLIIVENCKRRGHIVAVTGDGVNDAPALSAAHIGVAMGITGSDVAKEAASVILTNDDFSSIVDGVEEGRTIFDNLRKSIAYTLAHLLPELVPYFCNIIFQLPLALPTILLLLIDLGTELAPAVSLSYEEAESNIMKRPPRNPAKDRLVTPQLLSYSYLQLGIIETLTCFLAFFMTMASYGFPASVLPFSSADHFFEGASPMTVNGITYDAAYQVMALTRAQSAYFLTIILLQTANLLSCKTRFVSLFQHGLQNSMVNLAIPISIGLGIILVYTPGVQDIVGSGFVFGAGWWPFSIGWVVIFLLFEMRKFYARADPNGISAKFLSF